MRLAETLSGGIPGARGLIPLGVYEEPSLPLLFSFLHSASLDDLHADTAAWHFFLFSFALAFAWRDLLVRSAFTRRWPKREPAAHQREMGGNERTCCSFFSSSSQKTRHQKNDDSPTKFVLFQLHCLGQRQRRYNSTLTNFSTSAGEKRSGVSA